MQMQAQCGGRCLVPADDLQPIAVGAAGEARIGAVLDDRDGLLPAKPLDRARPVRGEDVGDGDLRFGRGLDHAAEAGDGAALGRR